MDYNLESVLIIQMMEDLTKLFHIGDQEHKGFLIRRDMQRLQGELALSLDELEAVFDSLDNESHGYLTLDKFLLGYSKHRATLGNNNNRNSGEDLIGDKDLLIPNDISSIIADINGNMFVSKTTSDHLKSISQTISDGETMSLWEQLLNNIHEDMKKAQDHIVHLENLLSSREMQHKSYMRKIYDEMETQVKEEREKVIDEQERRLNAMKVQVEDDISSKDYEISNLMSQNNELVAKLKESLEQEQRLKSLVKNLGLDQRVYASQLENLQKSILDLQVELDDVKKQATVKRHENFWDGFRSAQIKANIEENSFIQQLKILRNMQSILSPDHIDQLAATYNFKKKSSV